LHPITPEDTMQINSRSNSIWVGSVAVLALAVAVAGYFNAHHTAPVNAAAGTNAALAPEVPRVIVVPPQTRIAVRLDETISSRNAAGAQFSATVTEPVVVNDETVIGRGERATVRVVDSRNAGHLKGVARLSLGLDSVSRAGRSYPVETSVYSIHGGNHHKRNLISIGSGAGGGALIGGLAGGPVGAVIGMGAGAGAGTTVAAVTGKKTVAVPAETKITFALLEPAQIRLQ
jgi:hypothetical protein